MILLTKSEISNEDAVLYKIYRFYDLLSDLRNSFKHPSIIKHYDEIIGELVKSKYIEIINGNRAQITEEGYHRLCDVYTNCPACGRDLPIIRFPMNSSSRCGLNTYCYSCARLMSHNGCLITDVRKLYEPDSQTDIELHCNDSKQVALVSEPEPKSIEHLYEMVGDLVKNHRDMLEFMIRLQKQM